MEAAAAKERYWKLHEAGKTDQARADLARLAIIRKEREEKAKQRQVLPLIVDEMTDDFRRRQKLKLRLRN